jgi:hypothetical protein
MAVPILILLVGAASCTAIKRREPAPEAAPPSGIAEESTSAAA